MADPDIPFGEEGGGHEMRLNAKGTVGSFGGRKLIYNKIITRKDLVFVFFVWGGGGHLGPPVYNRLNIYFIKVIDLLS